VRETALLRDFYWLLHQGHVLDFASKGLEIPRRQPAKPATPPKPKPAAPSAESPAPVVETQPAPTADLSEPQTLPTPTEG